jgi:hypothetical protein
VVFEFLIENDRIVEIELIAAPARIAGMQVAMEEVRP